MSSIYADPLHPPVRKKMKAGRCDRQTDEESENPLKSQGNHLPALVTQAALNQFQDLTDEQQEEVCGGGLYAPCSIAVRPILERTKDRLLKKLSTASVQVAWGFQTFVWLYG